jgi:glucose-6-phosphate 1-dehydrogenase
VLGMATTQHLLAMRAPDGVLSALWSGDHIEEIEILWEETLALEGRAGFYDRTGALKDVLQNHMLQVLSLVAMEPPTTADEHDLHDAKVRALRAVRAPTGDDVARRTRRARYTAGRLADTGGADGRWVPAYADEDGVDAVRGTETYAEVVLEVDTPRWSGTRFRLRAGKAMGSRRKGVLVSFRTSPAGGQGKAEHLWIGLDGPNDVTLQLTGRAADENALAAVALTGHPPSTTLPPYARVLKDVLGGDSALSVRGDEAEESWRIVEPILQAWAAGVPPLMGYPAGSAGPPPPDVLG